MTNRLPPVPNELPALLLEAIDKCSEAIRHTGDFRPTVFAKRDGEVACACPDVLPFGSPSMIHHFWMSYLQRAGEALAGEATVSEITLVYGGDVIGRDKKHYAEDAVFKSAANTPRDGDVLLGVVLFFVHMDRTKATAGIVHPVDIQSGENRFFRDDLMIDGDRYISAVRKAFCKNYSPHFKTN
jgi:hypothetical protein